MNLPSPGRAALALLATLAAIAALAHGISEADRQRMLDGGYLQYVGLGASHMLTGYDHLLFLFGVVGAVYFFDRIRIDDPVGAVSVHGICGAWGVIAVGLFASEDSDFWKQGLFFGGGTDQLVSQIIGVVSIAAFVAIAMTIVFFAIKAVVGLRVDPHEELEGLDVHEHGYPGYGIDVAAGMGDEALVGALTDSGR